MAPHGPALRVRFHSTDRGLSTGNVRIWAETLAGTELATSEVGVVVVHPTDEPLSPELADALRLSCEAFAVQFRAVPTSPTATLAELDRALGVRPDDLTLLARPGDTPSPAVVDRLHAALADRGPAVADARPLPVAPVPTAEDSSPDPSGVCVLFDGRTGEALGQVPVAAAGSDLLRSAAAHGIAVVGDPAAPVFHDVRVGDDLQPVQAPPMPAAEKPPARSADEESHPANLPATSLAEVLRATGVEAVTAPAPGSSPSCFLTILTRTQGTRPQCLEEMLLCLAAQTDRDFEVVLACHRVSTEVRAETEAVVARFPEWLRSRVRLIEVDRPGRAAPLNDGLDAANGRYVVVLDDDDLVFAHWVETFRSLEQRAPGRVLRACALRQNVTKVEAHGRATAVNVGPPWSDWPSSFDLVDHLQVNSTPCMTVAFPRGVYQDLRYRFDERMLATEDWEYLVRAAAVVGVECSPALTSIYRWWVDEVSSRTVQTVHDWEQGRDLAGESFDDRVLLLPRSSARRVRELFGQIEEAWGEHTRAIELHDKAVENYTGLMERFRKNKERRQAAEAEVEELKSRLRRQRRRADRRLALMRELDALLAAGEGGGFGARRSRSRTEERSQIFDLSRGELEERIAELRGR